MNRCHNHFYAEFISKKTSFSLHNSHIPHKPKRASFDTHESLFFIKVGKVTFFVRKSLLCRYSALSLHSKTVGKWPISDSFSQSASTLGSLCLRSGFALAPLLRLETRWTQNGMKKTSTLYKVRAERTCSLCRAEQRHEVTLRKASEEGKS